MTDTPDVLRASAMIRLATADEQHAHLAQAEADADARLDLAAKFTAFHDAEFFAAPAGNEIAALREQWVNHINDHGCHDWVARTCSTLDALIARSGDLTRHEAQRQL